jgi:hypothetical protein
MRLFLYMKHSASPRDPLEASNEDASLIRIEKSCPFFSFQMLLVLCHAYRPWGAYEGRSKNPGGDPSL